MNELLNTLKSKYPNMRDFTINNDTLIYKGDAINVNLKEVPEVFFNLSSESIHIYLKNGLYKSWHINERIRKCMNELIITEEEIKEINYFILQLLIKREIIKNNLQFFNNFTEDINVRKFYNSFLESEQILKSAIEKRLTGYPANNVIANTYEDNLPKIESTVSNDLGVSLTRQKKGFTGYSEFTENEKYLEKLNKKDNLNIAGFTSIILIISTVIAIGSYLALFLIK